MVWKIGTGISCALMVVGLLGGCGTSPIPEEGVARGEVLFARCSPCHGDQGEGNPSLSAPPIAGMDAVYVGRQLENFANGVRGKHADDLEGIRMMPMARTLGAYQDGLRDEAGTQVNIEALGAYVAQLPAVAPEDFLAIGDATEGKGIFDTKCAACHGVVAEGKDKIDAAQGVKGADGEPIFDGSAPALAGQADWYLQNQLEKFQDGIRGHDAEADPTGATMVKWANQLDDEQTRDVVLYIASLK